MSVPVSPVIAQPEPTPAAVLAQRLRGTYRDIARQAKLPAGDVRQTLAQLHAAGLVVRRSRGEQRGADSLLFFLKDDLNALDFLPA